MFNALESAAQTAVGGMFDAVDFIGRSVTKVGAATSASAANEALATLSDADKQNVASTMMLGSALGMAGGAAGAWFSRDSISALRKPSHLMLAGGGLWLANRFIINPNIAASEKIKTVEGIKSLTAGDWMQGITVGMFGTTWAIIGIYRAIKGR
ncbi:MAG: hypothetical protein ACHREM_13525 [Polyangiales bacterium]